MPISAAIAGGAGLVGSLGSALIGSNAATTASGQQVALGQQALTTQTGLFDQALNWAQQLYGNVSGAVAPVLASGESAMNSSLPALQKLLTPGGMSTSQLANNIPGLAFATNWGATAGQNSGTTTGLGGNTAAAITNYATGTAEQGYTGLVGLLQNLFNSGSSTATGALSTLGSAAGSSASTVGNLASNTSNSLGGTLTGIGQSQAAGTLGSANALSAGLTGGTSSLTNALLLSKLIGSGGVGANSASGLLSGGGSS